VIVRITQPALVLGQNEIQPSLLHSQTSSPQPEEENAAMRQLLAENEFAKVSVISYEHATFSSR